MFPLAARYGIQKMYTVLDKSKSSAPKKVLKAATSSCSQGQSRKMWKSLLYLLLAERAGQQWHLVYVVDKHAHNCSLM